MLASQATRDLVAAELRDLGEHRLKDLAAPERIYQLGGEEFPPLRSLYLTNLPVPPTPFLGRERELAEVLELLADGRRVLTLTGAGGTGKTRLAAQAAAEAAESYPDGVWWIPLAPLRDPALVVPTIARTLGAGDDLAAHIADRELLLVVDNLEQVVTAAPDLASIVEACPNLRLLATSRERLRVRGEAALPVLPLAAANEDVANLLLITLPIDTGRVQRRIRLELERVLSRRCHFGLVECRDVQEEGGLLDVTPGKIPHGAVDIVVRVDEVQALDLVAIRFEIHVHAKVDLEDRRRQRGAR